VPKKAVSWADATVADIPSIIGVTAHGIAELRRIGVRLEQGDLSVAELKMCAN